MVFQSSWHPVARVLATLAFSLVVLRTLIHTLSKIWRYSTRIGGPGRDSWQAKAVGGLLMVLGVQMSPSEPPDQTGSEREPSVLKLEVETLRLELRSQLDAQQSTMEVCPCIT